MTDSHNLRLHFTAASDRGLVRGNNEDSAYSGPHLLVLADGMGGHAAGEIASQLMVEHLEGLDRDPGDNDMAALLGMAADEANAAIAHTVKRRPETEGMGTTLTALLFNGRDFGLIHVGDSRGYRLREGKLTQLTVDDTFVQSLVNEGKLDPEDVSSHPKKSLILKAYTGMGVTPHLETFPARPGDRLLLCSDGLSDPVTASTIEATLSEGTPEQAAQRLVELALRSGGPDNVTVVVADVVDVEKLSEDQRGTLPVKPLIAGALAGESGEATHPDTSAGRAAALRSHHTVSAHQSQREAEAARIPTSQDSDSDDDKGGPRALRWVALASALALILAAVGAGWWYYSHLDDQFFLATDNNDTITVEQGADLKVFGRDLHHTAQVACLKESGELQLIDASAKLPADCHRFSLQDLPETARGAVAAGASASYDEITGHLQNLADKALPVCLDVKKDSSGAGTKLNQPGVNCREI